MAKRSGLSKTFLWILMGLLFLGLGGFGAVNLSGNIRSIGTVGDKPIRVDQYARQLQNEIRAIEAQTQQPLRFAQAQQIGLDRAVLQRVVRARALDHEADVLGLSVGDETLRDDIINNPSFRGASGDFDREIYRLALQQGGLTENEFETTLREEAARNLLQGAVLGGIQMPPSFAEALVNYVGEQRSFTWTELDSDHLTAGLDAPTDSQLRGFYEENQGMFMLPETKQITYVWLSPDDMVDQVDVPEGELRAEYEARSAQYNQPERRLVERLVIADEAAADQAAAALEVGGTTFEALVQDRGLELADIDLGDVSLQDLGDASEGVFAAEPGEVVGPLPSNLGPALFRVNGVLPAQNVTFEEARADLAAELAVSRAVRAVEARAQEIDDQLAGGATLEQLADEYEVTLGSIDWHAEMSEGIAAYADFRQAAATVTEGDFPQIAQLDDGGIFALRLDASLPERPNPFEAAEDQVRAAWRAEQTVTRLTAQVTPQLGDLTETGSFQAAGYDAVIEQDQPRTAFIAGMPADFMNEVFEMAVGDVRLIPADGTVFVARLDGITPASADDQHTALLAQVNEQINQQLAQDLYNVFADDVVRRGNPQIDQRALQAVHVNFP